MEDKKDEDKKEKFVKPDSIEFITHYHQRNRKKRKKAKEEEETA